MATYTQENRLLSMASPLGPDVLLLTAFSCDEALSRLFTYRLEMLSEDECIAPEGSASRREWERRLGR
jgi:type VI secretion system secreted protein VgrG